MCFVGTRRQLIGAIPTVWPCPIEICRLLQSHGGRMRFFPAWNATALGPASFTTLRAYGAFLVSASVDAHGTVSAVSLASRPLLYFRQRVVQQGSESLGLLVQGHHRDQKPDLLLLGILGGDLLLLLLG